jgi:hypothetical protein
MVSFLGARARHSLAIRKRITDTLVETTDLVRHRSVVSEKFLNFFQNVAPEISEKRVKI